MAAIKTEKKVVPAQAKVTEKKVEKKKEQKENRFQRWWRETLGEMRKVSWPTPPEAWRLTRIVLIVMAGMALILGALDFIFSNVITTLLAG